MHYPLSRPIARFCFPLIFLFPTLLAAQDVGGNIVYTLADTARARVLMEEGKALLNTPEVEEGLTKIKMAEEIFQSLFGNNSIQAAEAMHFMARGFLYKGYADKAIELEEEVLGVRMKHHEPNSEEVASAHNDLGIYYRKAKQYEKAIFHGEKALQIRLEAFDSIHPKVAKSLSNLGNVFLESGQSNKALAYLFGSIAIHEKLKGETTKDHASVLNDIAIIYFKQGQTNKAIKYFENAASFYLNSSPNDAGTVYFNLGLIHTDLGNLDVARQYCEKAISLQLQVYGRNSLRAARLYHQLGFILSKQRNDQHALKYLTQSMSILEGLYGREDKRLAPVYNLLGVCYAQLSDFDRSFFFYNKALEIQLAPPRANTRDICISYNNLGIYYHSKKEFDEAKQFYLRSIQLGLESGEEGLLSQVGQSYLNLGNLYSDILQKDSAIECYQKALVACQKFYGPQSAEVAAINNSFGNIYLQSNDLEKAESFFRTAQRQKIEKLGRFHPDVGRTHLNLGLLSEKKGLYNDAEHQMAEGLEAIYFHHPDSLRQVTSMDLLIRIFNALGNLKRNQYQRLGEKGSLAISRDYFKNAITSSDYLLKRVSPESKSAIKITASTVYSDATATNFLLHQFTDSLHYLTEAFSFAERSKAMLLYEALQDAGALQVAGIPDSLLQQEYDLRVEIAYYDTRRQEKLAQGLSQTDTALLGITGRLFGLNRSYEELKNRLERDYPQYYKAKYRLDAISAGEVRRELLQPGQSLVEYLLGDSAIYIFLLQPEHFEVVEVKRDFPLEDWVKQMTKDGIYGYYTLPPGRQSAKKEAETIRNYTTAARQLYGKLWAPIKEKLTEQVIVIPDGLLGYLPFEALLTDAPPREGVFSAYPYLLHQHQLSYCYSATLLREMEQKQHRQAPTGQLLALAPFFQGDVRALAARIDTTDFTASHALRDSLAALPASGEEVAAVAKIWNGKPFYGADASTALFQQLAPRYRILHLSTHGRADDRRGDYAYLAFGAPGDKGAFDKLYARGLYNITLNTDMVFLSACETGIGKLQRGEGIVSLARAFAYAGAKSIVTTLWKVNDEKARELAIAFYTQLKAGKRKDEALRLAKLSYLEKQKGRGQGAHPFFWAGFIGIGDMSSLPSE